MGKSRPHMSAPASYAVVSGSLVLAVIVALVSLATSCGSGAPSASPTPSTDRSSGIRGIVLFAGGPVLPPSVSPSPLPGGFGSSSQGRPYGFVTVQVTAEGGAHAGHVLARIKPDSRALFTLAVPPGRYKLTPLVPKNGPFPLATTVVVRPDRYVRALVYVEGP
jgi:hypothetical protein